MARIGIQRPRHRFFLNPYQDVRFTTCPQCEGKTVLRKFPLLIRVEPANLLALSKSCRYCPRCDLIIAHQDELEAQLAHLFGPTDPQLIGNDYLVIGTLDRIDDRLHDFEEVLNFKPAGGWVLPEEK